LIRDAVVGENVGAVEPALLGSAAYLASVGPTGLTVVFRLGKLLLS